MFVLLRTVAVVLSLMAAAPVDSAVRTLADCTLPGFTPSEAQPFDLDSCTLNDGDDITQLLKDIGNQWSAIYVRAPSKTVSLISDTIQWATASPGKPIKTFVFLEDQSAANLLTITHTPSNPTGEIILPFSCLACADATQPFCNGPSPDTVGGNWDKPQRTTVMWAFGATGQGATGGAGGYAYIKIGGANLSMTFVGTQPGLANANTRRCGGQQVYPTNDMNVGLLDLRVFDGTSPSLADIRANTRNAEVYSVYFNGGTARGSGTNRTTQVNIAGTHWNTGGVFVHGGVRNLWFDPDRTVISDPYNRPYGWNGAVLGNIGGRDVSCYDRSISSNGRTNNSGPFYVDSLTGGVRLEYGYVGFSPRNVGTVGSASAPFIVRLKDWGSSGPGTGFPAGVMIKKSSQSIFWKGDPHPADGNTSPFRFVKFISLPSDYGQGVHGYDGLGCGGPDALDNTIRFEANDNTGVNALWDVTFEGDWTTQWLRGQLVYLAFEPWNTGDRSWGHRLRAASGMTFTDTIQMHDTNTLTGPGTFTNITVAPVLIYQTSTPINAKNNVITQTNVSGTVTVSASQGTTTISQVNFTGSPRAVITIGSGSTVVASNLCVPNGSTITGTGTLTYNGVGQSLPYTITPTTGCSIPSNPIPSAPTLN